MTAKKINSNEFNSWGNEIWEIAETILKNSNESPEEKKKISSVISAFCVTISTLKNTFALESFKNALLEKIKKYSQDFRESKFNFPCEDGVKRKMTCEEWGEYLHQRVEDHHRARVGKDIKEQDLPLILQRINKIDALDKEKEEEKKLLMSKLFWTDKEGYDLVYGILELEKKVFDITREHLNDGDNIEKSIQKSPYFFEDLSTTLLKAQEAIEKDKNPDEGPNTPEPEEKKKEREKEEKKQTIKTLEGEIKELERQNKELTRKLSDTSLTPTTRTSLEEDLQENQKQRKAAQTRLDKLQKELKDTDNDSKKMNLAIGLGIFSAVVALICLVVVLVRRPRHRDY